MSSSARPVSPHYVAVSTPAANSLPEPLQVEVSTELSAFERGFEIVKTLSYMVGSICFMAGSILFYPSLATAFNSQAAVIGAWLFVIGCVFFLLGTNGDFINGVRYSHELSTPRRIGMMYNAATYVAAAAIFELGAIYFLPKYYAMNPSLGCWCFIVGCFLFDVCAINDVLFAITSHEEGTPLRVDLRKLISWGTLAAFGCFVGSTLFIIGSYFYLPEYITVPDIDLATSNMNRSINCFTIGCVFFITNAAAQIPGLIATVRPSSSTASTSKEAAAECV